ncbi:hypothetical protein QQS21_001492 [Conoideocrella luteorostrata]|uniref:Uncharacterized protein n=1 Tax=Conoideocrella luteorostrata TaxID=1105319 RepID=A0AAJ0G220_9HYPO|nr:hypothetical protein QQS21_001492 [Conoideocrella luteorostrata]
MSHNDEKFSLYDDSSYGDDVMTPSYDSDYTDSDTNTECATEILSMGRSQLPEHDKIFMIVERISRRAISISHGLLTLEYARQENVACHWLCVDKGGWLGFQNQVTAKYISRDRACTLEASAKHHQSWEYMHFRPTPNGYHKLLVPYGSELREVKFGDDLRSLVGGSCGEGMEFAFFQV